MGSVIAAQLYTVREFTQTPEGIRETLRKISEIGYKSVQLSALGPIDVKELKAILDKYELSVCATHVGYESLKNDLSKVLEEHKILECKYIAIGSLPETYRTEEGYAKFAKEASEVGKRMYDKGFVFGYHNHSFELERFSSGKTGLEILYEESDSRYFAAEIDIYWIQHGGGDPCFWIEKLAGRIPLVHLKDMGIKDGKQIMAEVGEGNLNWKRILDTCKNSGVEWYIVEQDICQRDPFESLKISLQNLNRMGIV